MSVPFEQLGPGQVGRLVYQVIGQDGPILNPKNIRYLAPASGNSFVPAGLPDVGVAVAGASLAVGVGNLVLTAVVLNEVRKLTTLVEGLVGWTEQADSKLDRLAQSVDRIEMKVEENNLRHSLQHILRKSANDAGVDLTQLVRAADELEKFADATGGFKPGGNVGIRLSADVADTLEQVWLLARSVRLLVFRSHNRLQEGDPERVWTSSSIRDYLLDDWYDWSRAHTAMHVVRHEFIREIASDIHERFTFADEEDVAHYQELITNKVADHAAAPLMPIVALHSLDMTGESLRLAETPEAAEQVLEGYIPWWLYRTSAGLVWRCWVELNALREGYDSAFAHLAPARPQLVTTTTPGVLEVCCEIPVDRTLRA